MSPVSHTFALTLMLACAFSLPRGGVPVLTAPHRATTAGSTAQGRTPPPPVKVKRLRPAAFAELPARITRKLERLGCTIPQVTIEGLAMNEPHNVVGGEFARRGQKDWAVLCSRRGRSAIHIFWGKPTRCANVIGVEPDDPARYIGTADAKYIREHYEAYGGTPPPPPPHHLGINDGYAEKGSQVWYCHRGKWLTLQGAD